MNLGSVLRLTFQFDILDIEGKDSGAGLSVCAVCVFGGFLVAVKVVERRSESFKAHWRHRRTGTAHDLAGARR
jgi:hypothetical protein